MCPSSDYGYSIYNITEFKEMTPRIFLKFYRFCRIVFHFSVNSFFFPSSSSVMLCLKENVLWRNNNSVKKDTEIEKVVLLQMKGMIQITVKFRAEKILCTFLMHQKSF